MHAQEEAVPIDHIGLIEQVQERRGSVVVVNFFATWCGPCLIEIPGLKSIREEFPESEVTLFGVSVDQDYAVLPAFMERMSFNYPIFFAKPGVAEFFSVIAIPKMLVYNPAGDLVIDHDGYMDPAMLKQEVEQLLSGE